MRRRLPPRRWIFKALCGASFPKITSLSIQTAFEDGEEVYVAELIDALAKQGVLNTVVLNPCDTFGQYHESGMGAYLAMVKTRGHMWTGLNELSLYHRSSLPHHNILHPVVHPPPPRLAALLLANPTLHALHLTGNYIGGQEISSILTCLSSMHLHTLTILVDVVRPSMLDALASSLPSLRTLHLKLNNAQPDGPFLEDLVRAIEEEKALGELASPCPRDLDDGLSAHLS
jgi:hypothetical protein